MSDTCFDGTALYEHLIKRALCNLCGVQVYMLCYAKQPSDRHVSCLVHIQCRAYIDPRDPIVFVFSISGDSESVKLYLKMRFWKIWIPVMYAHFLAYVTISVTQ
jgi:hypothetical protein